MPTFFYQKKTLQQAAVALLTVLLLLTAGCLLRPHTGGTDDNAHRDIFLLTTNDLHGRLEPFTIQKNQTPQIAGGFAGLTAQMNLIAKQQHGAVLRLNSGDTLTGPYATYFKGKALFGGLSRMGIHAATLGNHDLDRGPEALARALTHCSFPIVVTNIDLPPEHVLARALQPFALFERAGKRLLIIGLLTPDVAFISSPGPEIHILNPNGTKVQTRIRSIIKQHKPDLVIALTHLGLEQDRRLALNIPDINVICGGHSHDLLPPGKEVAVQHVDGRQTVIVQAGAGGITLGVLRIRLHPDKHPAYTWLPREISASSAQCPHMLAFIDEYRSVLPPTRAITITDTVIDCRSATLRSREAPIGNFIADSLRAHFNTDVALYNGGGVRGDYMLPAGPITNMDVETMLPFGNKAVVASISGALLRQILEHSVAYLPQPWGGFLQISGLRMRVDPYARPHSLPHENPGYPLAASSEKRILTVDIRGTDGVYHPLVPGRFYRIVTNSFLAEGGNGYYQFREARVEPPSRLLISDIILRRLAMQPSHAFETDSRINIQADANNH